MCACVIAQARVGSANVEWPESQNLSTSTKVTLCYSPLSVPVSTQCGHSSGIKEVTVISFVGRAAAAVQQAFPNHNLTKSPHMKPRWSGLCSARQPGVPPPCPSPPVGPLPPSDGTETLLAGWQRGSKHTTPFKETLNHDFLIGEDPLPCPAAAQQSLPVQLLLRPHAFPETCARKPSDKVPTASKTVLGLKFNNKLVWPQAAAATGNNLQHIRDII